MCRVRIPCDETFTCSKCGRELPSYIDGRLNIASAGNLPGLSFAICRECYGTPTADWIIEAIDLWMNPIQENPPGHFPDK